MPMGRLFVPSPFGMCTRRTGGAQYVPDLNRSRSDARFSSRFFAYSSAVTSSTPVAPSFRVLRYASSRNCKSMWWDSVVSAAPGICLASPAICWSLVDTDCGPNVSLMFPFNSSVTRPLASLHRIARGSVLRLPRYYQGAPTSHRPSRPALFRSPGRTTDCRLSRGSGGLLLTGSSSELHRCLNPLPSTHTRGDGGISQVPRQPLYEHALLFDPGGPPASGHWRCTTILPSAQLTASAPRSVTCRGSITQPGRSLSTLRSSDCSDRTPRKTHFPPVGQTLAGQDSHLLGCVRRFPLRASTHIVSSSSKLYLAHRPACRHAVRFSCASERPARQLEREV